VNSAFYEFIDNSLHGTIIALLRTVGKTFDPSGRCHDAVYKEQPGYQKAHPEVPDPFQGSGEFKSLFKTRFLYR